MQDENHGDANQRASDDAVNVCTGQLIPRRFEGPPYLARSNVKLASIRSGDGFVWLLLDDNTIVTLTCDLDDTKLVQMAVHGVEIEPGQPLN